MHVVGVILAGGSSSRMGRPKALLPLGGESFLVRIARVLAEAGVPDQIIVTGAHDAAIRDHLARVLPPDRAELRVVTNPDPSRGQLSSLLMALEAADAGDGPVVEALVVALVDHPAADAETVRALLAAFESSRAPVVRPVFRGSHGHPVILAREVFAGLRAASPREGARAVVRGLGSRVLDVPVEDPGVCEDIDTPEAYARLAARFG